MNVQTDARALTVDTHLRESAEVKRQTVEHCTEPILAAADAVASAFRNGHKLLLCGNGGSAADCQHLAAEFTSRLTPDLSRPGLPAIALTTDSSFLTAYANDFSFDGIFARQVQALGRPGDVLIGISTSGNSTNVVQAIEAAKTAGMKTIALIGTGGRLQTLADVVIAVPSHRTQYIQETHLAVEHLVCHLVERAVFGKNGERKRAA